MFAICFGFTENLVPVSRCSYDFLFYLFIFYVLCECFIKLEVGLVWGLCISLFLFLDFDESQGLEIAEVLVFVFRSD
ncbi:hypothetical protein CDL12_12974 [Handroanthus impetiginosus]|uniref:Uncharacterized protein n=1 Tax=Handroanthus impetiginosus TaxID=429701 RepID=A0A2G9HA43_9LAMI|nr:hypothetical protein CDL12_12974 [Handroanthus impetiginosus]